MKSPLRAHAVLIGMVLIWGVNFSVAKVALRELSPLAFNALRFPLASLLLLIVLRARGPLPLPTGRDLVRVLVVGLLGNVLYQLFFILGLDRTSAGNASLLLAGTPLITALLSAALGHDVVRARTWVGVSCTLAGIALIVTGTARSGSTHHSLAGDLLMLGSSMTWAFYTVGSRSLVDRYGPVPVTAWTLWVGTIGIVAIGLPQVLATDFAKVGVGSWAAVAYAGMLSIGLAYIMWYYGVSVLGNTRTSSYSNGTPVVALLCAWLALGETPRLLQLAGAAIIITGVTVAQTGSARRAADVSPEV